MVWWILSWLLSALLLLALGRTLPGFEIRGYGTALIATVVIALLNATLGLLLKILAFPLTLLTLGLFAFVVNALMLKLAAAIIPGFQIRGCLPALLAAVLLALINLVVALALGPGHRL